MQVFDLDLPGLKLIVPDVFNDERGTFFESYRKPLYVENGLSVEFVQDNISISKKNTLRGLHFQSHPGQVKLIQCLKGKIWDVVADVRPNSAFFTQWIAVELDDQNRRQLLVPMGYAHGFCVLSDEAYVHYKVSSVYDSATEMSVRWDDPDLNICWPVQDPILSKRDATSETLSEMYALDRRL